MNKTTAYISIFSGDSLCLGIVFHFYSTNYVKLLSSHHFRKTFLVSAIPDTTKELDEIKCNQAETVWIRWRKTDLIQVFGLFKVYDKITKHPEILKYENQDFLFWKKTEDGTITNLTILGLLSSCLKSLSWDKLWDIIIIFFLYSGWTSTCFRSLLLELFSYLLQVFQIIWSCFLIIFKTFNLGRNKKHQTNLWKSSKHIPNWWIMLGSISCNSVEVKLICQF